MSDDRHWARLVDRRSVNRGDQRRAALLTALDDLLRDHTLAEVNVGDISQRAGVTRSAFYFYFGSKAAAVMALMADLYDDSTEATELLVQAAGEPSGRISTAIASLFDSVDTTPHRYRALLEARAADPGVREAWAAGRADFTSQIAAMITRERELGHATAGPSASALAAVLLELNDHAVEVHAGGSGPARQDHIDALTHIWTTAIYGSDQA